MTSIFRTLPTKALASSRPTPRLRSAHCRRRLRPDYSEYWPFDRQSELPPRLTRLRPERALLCLALLAAACGDSSGAGGTDTQPHEQPPPEEVFPEKVTTIEIEVDYAAGAEPYTGNAGETGDVWDLFRANAEALFEGRDKTFVIPATLDDMQQLDDVPAGPYDYDEIVALRMRSRSQLERSVVTYYVVWLDGATRSGSEQPGVLGVSLSGTGIIAMFKPVIESTSSGRWACRALCRAGDAGARVWPRRGLVNNGIALTSDTTTATMAPLQQRRLRHVTTRSRARRACRLRGERVTTAR